MSGGKLGPANRDSIDEVQAHRKSVSVALLVAGAFFMENLDGTVIATALPQMALSFGAHPIDLNLGMTVYMLTLAVFIPVSGWVADRVGARAVFSSAIGLFTLASMICGISNTLTQFTAARVLQGIGGAMMVPVGRLVVLRITEKKDLMRSMTYITWPGLIAPVLGPPLGGFITTYSSWRWIFYLNVPLGVIGTVLALWWTDNQRENTERRFDWLGFALAGSACVAFMYSLELMGQETSNWNKVGALLGYSLLAGALAAMHMRRTEHPLIDFACLKRRTFAVAIWGGSLFRIGIMASPFLLPLMFQMAFGLNAFQSGLLVLTMFAGNLAMKSVTTPVLRLWGFRSVLLVNGIVSAFMILALGLLSPSTPKTATVAVLFLHGLSRSMQFTALNTLAFVDIPKTLMSSATSFAALVQQMGMGLGVAVGAVALRCASWLRGERAGALKLMDFHLAFWMMAVLGVLAVLDCFTLPRDAGAEVSGHRTAA
jgi:EmrB/QacA subfamily drug resistance transporter